MEPERMVTTGTNGHSGGWRTDDAVASQPGHVLDVDRGAARWVPLAAVVVVIVVLAATGMRGADYPAHSFRTELWRRDPSGTWNFLWFGGHSTFAYTVLAPPVSALISTFGLLAASSIAMVSFARWWFPQAARSAFGSTNPWVPRVGIALAVLVAIDNLIVGRVAFGFGFALGLLVAALWWLGRRSGAIVAAPVVGLASPVAAVLLLMVVATVLVTAVLERLARFPQQIWPSRPAAPLGEDHRAALGFLVSLGASVTAPLFLMAMVALRASTSAGFQPFDRRDLALSLGVLVTGAVVVDRPLVRVGAVLGLVAIAVMAAVPNPLGGNLVRYVTFVALPVGAMFVAETMTRPHWIRDRRLRAAATVVVVVVGFGAVARTSDYAIRNVARWVASPIHGNGFYAPMIDAMLALTPSDQSGLSRVEVVPTELHTEAAATPFALAITRGWERQIDRQRNAVLYDEDLTAEQYRAWLDANAVGYVAVPIGVELDVGGRAEAALIEGGIGWLYPVWSNADWQLFAVRDAVPMARHAAGAPGDARVVAVDATGVTIDVDVPGAVQVAMVYDQRLIISPSGCLRPAGTGGSHSDRNLVIEVDEPGTYRVAEQAWAFLLGGSSGC